MNTRTSALEDLDAQRFCLLEQGRERHLRWRDPMESLAKLAGLSGIEALSAIASGDVPPPPIAILMNIRLIDVSQGAAALEADPAEEHYNTLGVVHGGFALTVLDSTLGCAIQSALPAKTSLATIDLHARMLRPITKNTGTVRCEARIVSLTRTLGTSEARITAADGTVLATGTTACMIRRQV